MDEGAPKIPTHDLSRVNPEERRATIEQVIREQNEQWVIDALVIDQPFSSEEQHALIEIITDPQIAFEVLTSSQYTSREFTIEQEEKLFAQIENDPEIVQIFYDMFVESGVIDSPTETEARWIKRLEELLER